MVVVPLLTAAFGWAMWNLPTFVEHGRNGIRLQQLVFDVAWDRRDWPAMALAVLSIALILVPLVGVAVVLWRLATSAYALARAHAARTRERGAADGTANPILRRSSRRPTSPTP